MQTDLDILIEFFKINQDFFKKSGAISLKHLSVFDDMDGAYFLVTSHIQANKESMQEDFDGMCQKRGISSKLNSRVGYLLMQKEHEIKKTDTLDDFLKNWPDDNYYYLYLSNNLESILPQKQSNLKKKKI